jgi:hypothetical protein
VPPRAGVDVLLAETVPAPTGGCDRGFRLVIIYLRGRRLAVGQAATSAHIPAGLGA